MKNRLLTFLFFVLYVNLASAQWVDLGVNQSVRSTFKSGNTILAGTENGVYYKLESEQTWHLATGLTTRALSFYKDGDVLYVSTVERLYKSTSNGSSWVAMPVVIPIEEVTNIYASGNNFAVGMKGSGVYYSTDGGNIWNLSQSSWQSNNSALLERGGVIYSSFQGGGYLQYSINNGKDFASPLGDGIKITDSYQDITTLSSFNKNVLLAGTKNGGIFDTYNGVYFSYDNGDHWEKRVNGLANTAINSIVTIGNVAFAGTDGGGVYYSTNEGGNWVPLNSGLTNLTVAKLYAQGASLFACTSTGLFKLDVCSQLQGTSILTPPGTINLPSGGSIVLRATEGGIGYIWFKDDMIIEGVNTSEYLATESGTYRVQVIYGETCADISNIVIINIQTTPVTLLSFTAAPAAENVMLKWKTATEANADYFGVECSTDGINYKTVGKVPAKGNSNVICNYEYKDATAYAQKSNVLYYRLKCVDRDGSKKYSKTAKVNLNSVALSMTLYPNPVKTELNVKVLNGKDEKAVIQISDMQGKLMQQTAVQLSAGSTSININTASLAKGSYVIKVMAETAQQLQFVKE